MTKIELKKIGPKYLKEINLRRSERLKLEMEFAYNYPRNPCS